MRVVTSLAHTLPYTGLWTHSHHLYSKIVKWRSKAFAASSPRILKRFLCIFSRPNETSQFLAKLELEKAENDFGYIRLLRYRTSVFRREPRLRPSVRCSAGVETGRRVNENLFNTTFIAWGHKRGSKCHRQGRKNKNKSTRQSHFLVKASGRSSQTNRQSPVKHCDH